MKLLGQGSGYTFYRLSPYQVDPALAVPLMEVERYAYAARFTQVSLAEIDATYLTNPDNQKHLSSTLRHMGNTIWFWVVAMKGHKVVGFGIFKPITEQTVHIVELHVHGGTPPFRKDNAQGKGVASTIMYFGLQEALKEDASLREAYLAVDRLPGETHPWQWYKSLDFIEIDEVEEHSLGTLKMAKLGMRAPLTAVMAKLRPKSLVK